MKLAEQLNQLIQVGREDFSGEVLAVTEWQEIRRINGWEYSHCPKSRGMGVAVIAYDELDDDGMARIVVREENIPSHTHHGPVSLTGLVDDPNYWKPLNRSEKFKEIAAKELFEEAGYTLPPEKFEFLGVVHPSKGSDTLLFLYGCFVGDILPVEPPGDGTEGEKKARTKIMRMDTVLSTTYDPVLITMLVKTMRKGMG